MAIIDNPVGVVRGGLTAAAGDTVTNEGTISALAAAVTLGANGTLLNALAATIIGGTVGATIGANSDVTNNGTIIGLTTDGVDVGAGTAGGPLTEITNAAGSSIQGHLIGLLSGADSTVLNLGSISGGLAAGVQLGADGVFQNGLSGTVTGATSGVAVGASSFVTNDARIGGSIDGIVTGASSTVINNSLGLVEGATGIAMGAAAIVHDAGTIIGLSADGIDVGAGSTIEVSGTVEGHTATGGVGIAISFGDAATTSVGNRLILEASSKLVGIAHGSAGAGTNTLELGSGTGTLIDFNKNFENFTKIVVDAGGHWTISGGDPSAPLPTFTVAAGATLIYDNVAACFLRGTMIATPAGEVAVEDLSPGDMVSVVEDGLPVARAVIWMGGRHFSVTGSRDGGGAFPVRIRRGAMSPDVPHRDLLVTPEHCVLTEAGLTPVRMLVNGGTILIDRSLPDYEVFHIELEHHGILLSEGLATESYLDSGNRGLFRHDGAAVTVRADLVMAAPLAVGRDVVEPVWNRLADRARAAGFTVRTGEITVTDQPDLRLMLDNGRELTACWHNEQRHMFRIPCGSRPVRLLSRSSSPSDVIGPFVDDRRILGVAVEKLVLWNGLVDSVTPAADLSLAGWHDVEGGCRWTDGNAELDLPVGGAETFLDVRVSATGRYGYSAPLAV